MEQNNVIITDNGSWFKEVASTEPSEFGTTEVDEVERLIQQQYPWQLNDVEQIYSGIIEEIPDDEDEQTLQNERQSFLAWLRDKPQRVYVFASFEKLLETYSQIHNLRKLLAAFYDGGEYKHMVEELMKYEDRATEIPLLMVVDSQNDERVVHAEIRQVWYSKLNKKKRVIVVVIDESKLQAME